MTTFRLAAALLTAALVGCGSLGRNAADRPPRNNLVLTYEEMRVANYRNAYDAVAALRAYWIWPQGPASFMDQRAGQVSVFMEEVLLGDANNLRHFHITGVRSIRYLNVTDAAARFGVRAKSGPAIVVTPSSGPDRR